MLLVPFIACLQQYAFGHPKESHIRIWIPKWAILWLHRAKTIGSKHGPESTLRWFARLHVQGEYWCVELQNQVSKRWIHVRTATQNFCRTVGPDPYKSITWVNFVWIYYRILPPVYFLRDNVMEMVRGRPFWDGVIDFRLQIWLHNNHLKRL